MVATPTSIVYPDSDGLPMSDNTRQFEYIVYIKKGVDWLFGDNPQVFVGGDLLWYPVEGNNKLRQAPDVMVAFGRPKGERGSYQQWKEENIPPQVVFEIISPGNTIPEMTRKFQFYERYGVEEYYIYDPDRLSLGGFLRQNDRLEEIEVMEGWVSPRLKVRFTLNQDGGLDLYRPDGRLFERYEEIAARAEQAERRANQAEAEVDRLKAQLRAMGHNPDDLIGTEGREGYADT
ncbi:MAG: Uma2 family endonuclease [Phormidesmis sp. CAN_BIN36]|nr:Uma2 family endonuclease [Phormidesmis sp. CAN_BIN36]